MNIAISEFLQGFGPGFLFSSRRRPGAATQVFATEEVPCDEEVQQAADTYLKASAPGPNLATPNSGPTRGQ